MCKVKGATAGGGSVAGGDPADGRPSQDPAQFAPVLEQIARHPDVVINLTSGGSPFMSVEERTRPAAEFSPELPSLNLGS